MASLALLDFAKRAVLHPNTAALAKRAIVLENAEGDTIEIPGWGFALLYVSVMASLVGFSLLSYMLQSVITTLCMVESPVAAITVSPSTHESGDHQEKEGLLETGPTITLVNQKPITSSIRGTVKHLVANAGRWARFRGIKQHGIYAFCFMMSAQFFGVALPRVPGQPILVAGISGALVANLHAAWAHKVVSMPTTKSLWQRIPSRKQWKTLAVPAAIEAAMPYVSLYMIAGFGMLLGLHKLEQENFADYKCAQWTSLIVRVIAIFVFTIFTSLFLCLPAMVTLIRIEASILPEEEDTIVPFDRTFGGKVVEKMMGGTGVVGFLDAWRSFNWEARRRLIKLFMKISLIMTGVIFITVHVLAFEVFAIMGPSLGKLLSQMKHGL